MADLTLIDVLHELISQETAQLTEIPMCCSDARTVKKHRNDLIRMRKISKRDAYYRVIHILHGYDTEFPQKKENEV